MGFTAFTDQDFCRYASRRGNCNINRLLCILATRRGPMAFVYATSRSLAKGSNRHGTALQPPRRDHLAVFAGRVCDLTTSEIDQYAILARIALMSSPRLEMKRNEIRDKTTYTPRVPDTHTHDRVETTQSISRLFAGRWVFNLDDGPRRQSQPCDCTMMEVAVRDRDARRITMPRKTVQRTRFAIRLCCSILRVDIAISCGVLSRHACRPSDAMFSSQPA